MPKHDKPILDVSAIRINRDHFRHWKTHFHDYCLLEGYRNPAKDRLTQTTDHYIEAKRPFELAVLHSAIPSLEWNTLDNVIASKIPADDADKPWIWLQKIKEHYVGTSTLMQDRYHFWVQMAQADQTSISAWETAVRTAAGRCSFGPNADEFVRDKFLFGFNESFSRFREDIFYRDGQCKPKDPPFTLAFVVSQAVSFEAAQQTNKLLAHSSEISDPSDHRPKSPSSDATPTGISCLCKTSADHLNGEALGFMVKLSTVQPPARTASTRAISCSVATGPSCIQPEHAPKQPLPLPLMQPSVPATPGHKPAQPLPAAPLQIERTVTPPPTQPQQKEQQISETPVVHVNQQTTRSGRVVRLPQKYKDFVLS
ncbi:hypothetical protein pdam_00021136 [Pocillopora damicornis]|uniref:Uncharacterized protein n=1 Tax=Pocillopora damicornis TaxID=46731 RepID=A0A3M6V4K8_POCDA|nr:hypothetical protein pdam_00021136 [Pocillopora damicornis]